MGFILNYSGTEINELLAKIENLIFIEEILNGTINSINCVFTTSQNFVSETTKVYVNGIKQVRGVDYTETNSNEITFSQAPDDHGFDDVLIINYIKE